MIWITFFVDLWVLHLESRTSTDPSRIIAPALWSPCERGSAGKKKPATKFRMHSLTNLFRFLFIRFLLLWKQSRYEKIIRKLTQWEIRLSRSEADFVQFAGRVAYKKHKNSARQEMNCEGEWLWMEMQEVESKSHRRNFPIFPFQFFA